MKPIQAPPPTRLRPSPPRARESLLGLVADLLRRSWSKVDASHYLDDYERSQWLAPEALRELQLAKLRRLVWHCFLHVPWHAPRIGAALRPSRIERLDGLELLPIAGAAERRDAKAFVATTRERVGELRRTWGTRGAPDPVIVDVGSVERQKAVRLRSERWAGARGDDVIAAWGRDALREARALDGAELDALLVALARARGAVVSGPGPSLARLAARLAGAAHESTSRESTARERGAGAADRIRGAASRGRVAAVIARGEDPDQGGAQLAALSGARLHRWYGAAEVGVIAASCDRWPDGAAMHVHADHLILEIVDDAGRILPPGARGRVLITDLHNFAAPYLRHELGDLGRLIAAPCACGRALPLVEIFRSRVMRVLVITKIFPNALEPLSSPFNRQQFAALGRLCDVEVLASIPWFPGARAFARWSAAGRLVDVPATDLIDGLSVRHPRFLFLPRYGHALSAALYAASLLPAVLRHRGRVDVVLGSWAYPDGAAAVALAELLAVPAVVKLHGSDINVVAHMPGPRRQLRWALPRARRVVAVSRALADEVVALGVPRERVAVVSNGIDPALFHPRDRAGSRAALGLAPGGKLLLYVGRLERAKGVIDLLDAFARLAARRADLTLALVGDGAARGECAELAGRLGDRVKLAGARPLAEVPLWLGACDLLTLPSWNEGTPNVLLEALACGRPVVATRVGGIPDVVSAPSLGELVPAKDPAALADALERIADASHDAAAVAKLGARGGWADSAARLLSVLEAAVADSGRRAA